METVKSCEVTLYHASHSQSLFDTFQGTLHYAEKPQKQLSCGRKGHFGHYIVQFCGQDIFLSQYRGKESYWCAGELNQSHFAFKDIQLPRDCSSSGKGKEKRGREAQKSVSQDWVSLS